MAKDKESGDIPQGKQLSCPKCGGELRFSTICNVDCWGATGIYGGHLGRAVCQKCKSEFSANRFYSPNWSLKPSPLLKRLRRK